MPIHLFFGGFHFQFENHFNLFAVQEVRGAFFVKMQTGPKNEFVE